MVVASLFVFQQIKKQEFINSTLDIRQSTYALLEFLSRLDWALAASGGAYMKLQVIVSVKVLNVEHSMFDVRRSSVSFSIKLADQLGNRSASSRTPETFTHLSLQHSQLSLPPCDGINNWS